MRRLETPIAIDPGADSHVRTKQRRGGHCRDVTGELKGPIRPKLILGCGSGTASTVLFNPNARAATKYSAWNGIIRSGRLLGFGFVADEPSVRRFMDLDDTEVDRESVVEVVNGSGFLSQ